MVIYVNIPYNISVGSLYTASRQKVVRWSYLRMPVHTGVYAGGGGGMYYNDTRAFRTRSAVLAPTSGLLSVFQDCC